MKIILLNYQSVRTQLWKVLLVHIRYNNFTNHRGGSSNTHEINVSLLVAVCGPIGSNLIGVCFQGNKYKCSKITMSWIVSFPTFIKSYNYLWTGLCQTFIWAYYGAKALSKICYIKLPLGLFYHLRFIIKFVIRGPLFMIRSHSQVPKNERSLEEIKLMNNDT